MKRGADNIRSGDVLQRLLRWRGVGLPLVFLGGVLVAASIMQFFPPKIRYHHRLAIPLTDWLPQPVAGWTFKDLPVSATPEIAKAVDRLLNFDDGIYRVYRSANGRDIQVYVGYWSPGRMDPRLISLHSPDVCWVGAGWQRVGVSSRRTLKGEGGTALRDGHDRNFEMGTLRQNVVFWHLVGGKPSIYLEPGRDNFFGLLRAPFADSSEQYFIRISSSASLEFLAGDPMMQHLVGVLSVAQAR